MARGPAKETQPATDDNQAPGTLGEDVSIRRRRALLAGHTADPEAAVALIRDPEPSVRMAALGALARLTALRADTLVSALVDPDPSVRRRAASIAGHLCSSDPPALEATLLLDALTRALHDGDPAVVEAAAWALGEWGPKSEGASVEALCEVASGQRDPLCREAAVAALGAIGAARALPVVLAALSDKPAVRRRAAIALAAFDSPAAEEGLRRCLEDRDWQVRQAAEELLEGD